MQILYTLLQSYIKLCIAIQCMMMTMDFKDAVMQMQASKSQSNSSDDDRDWSTLDDAMNAFEKYFHQGYSIDHQQQEDIIKLTEVYLSKDHLLIDMIGNYYSSLKTYWQQFGFLDKSSIESFVSTIKTHITIDHIRDRNIVEAYDDSE